MTSLSHDGDVLTIYRCAATCRSWRRLVAGSSSLRRRWPSSLIGFFVQQCHVTRLPGTSYAHAAGTPPLAFVPSGRSTTNKAGLGGPSPPFRRLSSFVRDAPESLDGGEPLASRGSLLLVRLLSVDQGDDREPYVARLAVCDLLDGKCHLLPELAWGRRFPHYVGSYGYAILPGRVGDNRYPSNDGGDMPPPPTTFRVLMIGWDRHNTSYNLHIFAHGMVAWSTQVKCLNATERCQALSMAHAQAVVCGGHAHWLFSNMSNFHVLSVEVETGHLSLTKLLIPGPWRRISVDGEYLATAMQLFVNSLAGLSGMDRLTTVAGGTALSVYRSQGRWLEMWTRQEADGGANGDAEWLPTRVIELKLFGMSPELEHATCVCLGERSGMLVIMDSRRHMYIEDLETGALEEVTDQFQGHAFNRIVPVEIGWPRFPAPCA